MTLLEQMARAHYERRRAMLAPISGMRWATWEELATSEQRQTEVEAIKAALQPLLGDLPEGVKRSAEAAIDDYYMGDCLRYDEIGRIFHAMIKAILEESQ